MERMSGVARWSGALLLGWMVWGASTAEAGSKMLNLRYSLMTGPMAELGLGSFGLGVTAGASASYSGTNNGDTFTGSGRMMGGRLSWYRHGMGTDGLYLAVDGGRLTFDFKQTTSGSEYTGENSSVYYGVAAGYHWFWSYFNMHLGLGTISVNVKDTELKNSSGTVVDTIPGFGFSLPALDFGIGVAF